MNELSAVPPLIQRAVLLSGLLGLMVGVSISIANQDSLGWSLLRTGITGVAFAVVARWFLKIFLRTWIESKIELFNQQAELSKAPAPTPRAEVKK
jgi:hypothetical protein